MVIDQPGVDRILRNRREQRVDRRPVPVLGGAFGEYDPAVVDQQVMIGRGDIDAAVLPAGPRWRR
ncbi:MAG: hypothetical protein WBH51_05285 [Mycolicibacter algericus]|uniref:hypothetical protein n=1 Tax=Mycolicibacter algericus TaxID=1288388 RepID=UPI003C78C31A